MSAWSYLKAGFWQRVPLPLLRRIPLNPVAVVGFGVAGLDHPGFWVAGAAWEVIWLTATAGRVSYRRGVDASARRVAWRTLEERRLQLYHQLSPAAQQRHYALRMTCQGLASSPCDGEPAAAMELFTWLHLKLLLARQTAVAGGRTLLDPDVPGLQAGAAVMLSDPARARLAGDAVALLDPREGIQDHTLPVLTRIDEALQRIESELGALSRPAGAPAPDFTALARRAAAHAPAFSQVGPASSGVEEVDRLLGELQ
jgi:hypothetical protein